MTEALPAKHPQTDATKAAMDAIGRCGEKGSMVSMMVPWLELYLLRPRR
jgi:hypothetical protein